MVNLSSPEPPAEILSQYCSGAKISRFRLLAGGNINQTFLIEGCGQSFVLQRIAGNVFPRPEWVVKNFLVINRHVQAKMQHESLPVIVAQPRPTLNGRDYCFDSTGTLWRALGFLPHTPVSRVHISYESLGQLLATFHRLLEDLDCSLLQETLPGFHDLTHYFGRYDAIASRCPEMESSDFDYAASMVERFRPLSDEFVRTLRGGNVRQPVHGDPKLENFLFDERGRALALIDLDTVGPGCIQSDLGDCLRSCCNPAGEKALGSTYFDMERCRALLSGYLGSAIPELDWDQRNVIYDGLLMVTFELGLRFFTDHLAGNSYFKISYPGENLQRAINQFRLVEAISLLETDIRKLLK